MARIRGTNRTDILIGTRNDDTIDGLGGHDLLYGGAGNDIIHGGDGMDLLVGDDGRDSMYGDAGDDMILGAAGDAMIDGGAGTDIGVLDFRRSTANLTFSIADNLRGPVDVDGTQVRGIDWLWFEGGSGSDQLQGGALGDDVRGNGGDDYLFGAGGDDYLAGGAGIDLLDGSAGNDTLDGGDGGDTLTGGRGSDRLSGRAGDDMLIGGFAGDETIADRLLDGGAGTDFGLINMAGRSQAIDFSVAANLAGTVTIGATEIRNFERISFGGGGGNDRIAGGELDDAIGGGDGHDSLDGRDGTDLLYGQLGDDLLTGGAGRDFLYGGAGLDTAIFSGARADYDIETLDNGAIRVTDRRAGSPDGSDDVWDIERFAFTDGVREADDLEQAPNAVNDADIANEDSIGVEIDVLANDSDPEGGPLTLVAIDAGQTRGTATLTAFGTVLYTPNGAFDALRPGQTATDSFTYTVRDAAGKESTATVTMTIIGENDRPTPVADTRIVSEDDVIFVNPVTNDDDPEGDALSLGSIAMPDTRGIVDPPNGDTFAYRPGAAFQHLGEGQTATDIVYYTARDPHGGSAVSTVTFTVVGANDAPQAQDDAIALDAGASLDGLATILLANDSDPDDGDSKEIIHLDASGLLGELIVESATGTLRYVANDPSFAALAVGESATTSFSYTVRDGSGAISTATVQVTVNGTAPPVDADAEPDALTILGKSGAIDLTDLVLGNDIGSGVRVVGVDGLSFEEVPLFVTADGRLIYDPGHKWYDIPGIESASDSFTYAIEDLNGNRSFATVSLTIQGIGDHATYVTVAEDSASQFYTLLMTEAEELLGSPVARVEVDPSLTIGTVRYDPAAATLVYTASHAALDPLDTGDVQETSFSYKVIGTNGDWTTGIFVIDVEGRPEPFAEAASSAFVPAGEADASALIADAGLVAAAPLALDAGLAITF